LRGFPLSDLAKHWRNGQIKQTVIARTLALRKAASRLFAKGSYLPIRINGPQAEHVIAFARQLDDVVAIVAVSRCVARLLPGDGGIVVPAPLWQDTRFEWPRGIRPGPLRDRLTGKTAPRDDGAIASLFSSLPVAILTADSVAP
jgi:(1->4)-alpha-D-glucan 1-alpha-D-glucosylmutase